jgi:hypothetical protein
MIENDSDRRLNTERRSDCPGAAEAGRGRLCPFDRLIVFEPFSYGSAQPLSCSQK